METASTVCPGCAPLPLFISWPFTPTRSWRRRWWWVLSIGKTITDSLPAAIQKALPAPATIPFCHCLSSLVFTTQVLISAVNVITPFYIRDGHETKPRNWGQFRNLRNVIEEKVVIGVDELRRRIKLLCTGDGNWTSSLTLLTAYKASSTLMWLWKRRLEILYHWRYSMGLTLARDQINVSCGPNPPKYPGFYFLQPGLYLLRS